MEEENKLDGSGKPFRNLAVFQEMEIQREIRDAQKHVPKGFNSFKEALLSKIKGTTLIIGTSGEPMRNDHFKELWNKPESKTE